MSTLINDIKYAFRQLRKSPGFTAVAVISLALGIGAGTSIFSLFDSLMLCSLPVKDARDLRILTWAAPPLRNANFWYGRPTDTSGGGITANVFTYPVYNRFREQVAGQVEIFGFVEFTNISPMTVLAGGQASTARGLMVSGNFFRGLGLSPLMGQSITSEHDKPDVEPVTVISYAAWQQHFNGDLQVLGRTVMLNNNSFKIIGVLPKRFHGLVTGYRSDYYIPFASQPRMCPNCSLTSNNLYWVQVMARLAPGTDELQVKSLLDVLFARSVQEAIPDNIENTAQIVIEDGRGGPLIPRRTLARSLWLLLGLVGILLLVTCVNLAGLLLARGVRRHHELAVRAALGAGRLALIRQLLIESLLIALAGAGLGLVLALWGRTVLIHLLWPAEVTLNVQSDMRIFCFAVIVSAATALLAGLIPALRSTRGGSASVLRERSSSGLSHLRWGRLLVSVQMGLSLFLLMGAGLFARTLLNLYRIDTGFNTNNLLVFKLDVTKSGYQDQALVDFYEQVRSSIEALPGVNAAANSHYLLLSGGIMSSTTIRVNTTEATDVPVRIQAMHISDSFLSTMGIPLLRGRNFRATDRATGAKVVIVNQTLARTVFPNEDPIGRRWLKEQQDYEIIGVCGDIKDTSLKKQTESTVFYPYYRLPQNVPPQLVWSYYAVQTSQDPMTLIPAVRKVVAGIDPTVPLTNVKTQAIQLDESIADERCFASLAITLSLMAVVLSCVGLYSIMAYNVSRRINEIGLRMALGATTGNIAWTVLRSALIVVAAGIIVGVPAVFATFRVVRSYLFGIEPYDPATLTCVIVLLTAVAIFAAWLPARRAAKIDPMEALRYE